MRGFLSFMLFSSALLVFGQDNSKGAKDLVENFVKAFNSHNVAEMAELVSNDLLYMFISDDKLAVETSGKPAFIKAMTQYFAQIPSARSESEAVMVAGNLVTVRERAHWNAESGPRSQMSLAVYQIKYQKIHRVWYYPATP